MIERLELTVSLRSQNWFVLGLTSETADLLLAFPAAVVTALLPLRKNSFAKG
jgi:flagellar biogenesis protein FliO